MADFYKIIDEVLRREGVADNRETDSGGLTIYGISQKNHPEAAVFKRLARFGNLFTQPHEIQSLRDLIRSNLGFREEAVEFYEEEFWLPLRLDEMLSQSVAEELFDTAVNCGVGKAQEFFERALNLGNRAERDYPNVPVDRKMGDLDLKYLETLVTRRTEAGVVKLLNVLQGARYVEVCEAKEKNEEYLWGWLTNRVVL